MDHQGRGTTSLLYAALISSVVVWFGNGRYSTHPAMAAAPASQSASPSRVENAEPIAVLLVPPARPLLDSIVFLATSQLGIRYALGGTSPGLGFDCSGLVRYILANFDVKLPRTARQQAMVGAPIARDSLLPGDLLTFGNDSGVTHVGLYVGSGKFVHASSVAGRVVVSRIDRLPSDLVRPLRGARRLPHIRRRLAILRDEEELLANRRAHLFPENRAR